MRNRPPKRFSFEFGQYLGAHGTEFSDAPGVVEPMVALHTGKDVDLGPDELRQLSVNALAAAEWLEAQA